MWYNISMNKIAWILVVIIVAVAALYVFGPRVNSPEPTVVYTPGGQFSESERSQLTERLVNPFFDFQSDQGQRFLTMSIARSIEGAYTFTAISDEGVTHQAAINRRSGAFDWWVPDCLDGCTFSKSFAEKYPEIVGLESGR